MDKKIVKATTIENITPRTNQTFATTGQICLKHRSLRKTNMLQLKAFVSFLILSTLFILPNTASHVRRDIQDLTPVLIAPSPVSVQLSTHQLSTSRPIRAIASNKAFFISSGATNVDVYDADTNTWSISTSNIDSLGEHFATADDYLVFYDTTNTALLHILNAKTLSWSTVTLPEGLARYYVAVGNYLFYSGTFAYTLMVYNIAENTWQTFEEQYEMADSNLIAFKYQTYAIFARRTNRAGYVTGWNTVNTVTRSTFDYGGNYRLFPTISVSGDYLVIAGGVFETDYSSDFSIYNPQSGQQFTGNMPTARYAMTIVYVNPLMLFIKDALVESFNLQTQQWQTGNLEIELSETRVSTGHKLFMIYGSQNYVVEFDSTSQDWSNITFSGSSSIGDLVKLGDLAAFVDTSNIVLFNPNTQQWTKAQFSSAKQFSRAFSVGEKVLIVSSDDQTVDVTELSQLSAAPVTPQASPVPVNPTPTTAPTTSPTTVPWSPWTMPTTAPTATNTPTLPTPVSNAPIAVSNPVTSTSPTVASPTMVPSSVPTTTNIVTSSASLLVITVTSLFALVVSAVL